MSWSKKDYVRSVLWTSAVEYSIWFCLSMNWCCVWLCGVPCDDGVCLWQGMCSSLPASPRSSWHSAWLAMWKPSMTMKTTPKLCWQVVFPARFLREYFMLVPRNQPDTDANTLAHMSAFFLKAYEAFCTPTTRLKMIHFDRAQTVCEPEVSRYGVEAFIYLRLHTYIHSFIHVCLHTHIHTYIHSNVPSNMHTYIHTFTCAFIHVCIHSFTCARGDKLRLQDMELLSLIVQCPL